MHGHDDDRVPPGRAVDAKARLGKSGVTSVEVALFKKMGHGMNDEMLTKLSDFLHHVLPLDGADDSDDDDDETKQGDL
jgi:predicted esterase